MTPLNHLERLLAHPKFGPQSYPELFRLLRESELVFLLPNHPEMEGSIDVRTGERLPPFVVWQSQNDGRRIPIFSSLERANEACQKTGAKDGQYALCEMKGRELFDLISCQKDPVVINPACGGHAVFLDLDGVKQISKAPYFEPAKGQKKQGPVKLIAAADYPTDLVNSVFQLLRERKEVQAAWLGQEMERTEPGTAYIFLVLATGGQEKLQQDILIVAGSACPKGSVCHVSFPDPANPEVKTVTAKFPPFYAAPGFKGPSPLG